MIREPWGAARSVAVALVIGVLAAGCTPTAHQREDAGAGPPAAQPASGRQALADEAASVVRQYWRARNLAYSQRDLGPLTGFEDQIPDILSRADIAYRRANGIPPDPSSTSSIREMHNYLTRPDRFPRWLLAAVTAASNDAAPEVYLLAFSKAAPEASWKLSWQAQYADNTPLPSIRLDADGFAASLTPAQQRATLLADASEIRRRLQDYRQQAATTTTPPRSSWFADTKDTYGTAKQLQADLRHFRLLGITQRLSPIDLDLPGFAVATRDGALFIVAIGEKTVGDYRAFPLRQDQNRISYDQRIPPGSLSDPRHALPDDIRGRRAEGRQPQAGNSGREQFEGDLFDRRAMSIHFGRRRVAALLVVCTLPALAGCTSRQRQVTYPIGQGQALAVVRSYAADWALVVSRRDREVLRRIQTGDALAVSEAELQAKDAVGDALPAAPTASEIKVFVPPSGSQRSSASFLAVVTWESPEIYPEREALEFQRAGPDGPWRVELQAKLIDNTPPPAIAADRGGRASTVDASRPKQLRFTGKQLVETLSSYYSDDRQDNRLGSLAGTLVAPGPFTSGVVKRRKQSNDSFQIQGEHSYRPGRYPATAYRLGDRGGLMLVSLAGTRRVYPKDPNLVPALQQNASRQGLSALVPPGQYTPLTFQIATMLAVEVPPAKSRGQLHVVGWREVDLSVDANPA